MVDNKKITAIILAAGTSTRMGAKNKLLLPIDSQPLIQKTISTVQASRVFDIVVVLGHDAEIIDPLIPKTIKRTINQDYHSGMTSSIQAGLKKSTLESDGYLIILSDQPGLDSTLLNEIIDFFYAHKSDEQHPIIVPFFKDKTGHPILFDRYYYEAILQHKEPHGCKAIIKANLDQRIKYPVKDYSKIIDVDTPEAYQKWIDLH